jgi:hypothetical protein
VTNGQDCGGKPACAGLASMYRIVRRMFVGREK